MILKNGTPVKEKLRIRLDSTKKLYQSTYSTLTLSKTQTQIYNQDLNIGGSTMSTKFPNYVFTLNFPVYQV